MTAPAKSMACDAVHPRGTLEQVAMTVTTAPLPVTEDYLVLQLCRQNAERHVYMQNVVSQRGGLPIEDSLTRGTIV